MAFALKQVAKLVGLLPVEGRALQGRVKGLKDSGFSPGVLFAQKANLTTDEHR